MKIKKAIGRILLVIILLIPFFIYPVLGAKKQAQNENQTVISQEAEEKDKDENGLGITWQTIALGGVAVTAGMLRMRHAKKLREAGLDEMEARQS